jgi:hypothetical protein
VRIAAMRAAWRYLSGVTRIVDCFRIGKFKRTIGVIKANKSAKETITASTDQALLSLSIFVVRFSFFDILCVRILRTASLTGGSPLISEFSKRITICFFQKQIVTFFLVHGGKWEMD